MGIADGLTLLETTDSDQIFAASALIMEANKFRRELDENLAAAIVNKLAEALNKR